MKITLDLPNPIYKRLKQRAASEGSSAKNLILRGIGRILREKQTKSGHKRVKLPIVRSKRPGKLHLENARIFEVISFP